MRPLSASDLLEIWERGAGSAPVAQALVILGSAFPQVPGSALAGLTIAQRDRTLFRLRALTFGSRLMGLATCPACGERLEMALDAHDFAASGTSFAEDAWSLEPGMTAPPNAEKSFQIQTYQGIFRQPTSADLAAIFTQALGAEAARQRLLETCTTSLQRRGKTITADALPPEVVESIIEQMEQAGPFANLTIASTCPACGHTWEIIFDIVSYFWSEISVWAARMMNEVHVLASAYGWREADILAMSAWRRQRYLELIGA